MARRIPDVEDFHALDARLSGERPVEFQSLPATSKAVESSADKANPNVSQVECGGCRLPILVKRRQYLGLEPIVCQSPDCSRQYIRRGGKLEILKPN